MNTIIGSECTKEAMFNAIGGWTSQFEINGKLVGGSLRLDTDARLQWCLEGIRNIKGTRVLELGPLEGAHTKMLIEHGVGEVTAIEGLSDCFLRCLVVKEVFQLTQAHFLFGDFCQYLQGYVGDKFDFVIAHGVLYHQVNPARLIYDLADVTDTVLVWAQVASKEHPCKEESSITAGNETYLGKKMYWGDTRLRKEDYCASLFYEAFWMYPQEMIRCFTDAGFDSISTKSCEPTANGDCIMFVARKR